MLIVFFYHKMNMKTKAQWTTKSENDLSIPVSIIVILISIICILGDMSNMSIIMSMTM